MTVLTAKFKVPSLFQFMFLSILFSFFLIGCGGDSSSGTSTTSSSVYTISFYDENLDFAENKSVNTGNITLADIKDGVWYKAGEDNSLTTYELNSDIRLYAVSNVIEITTQEELASINTDSDTLSGKYILLNDIDLNETKAGFEGDKGWNPIGYFEYNPFIGIFNGNFHKITNLWINRPSKSYIGFFGYVEGGNIRNLGIKIAEGKEVRGQSNVGGIAGMAKFDNGNVDYKPVIIINSYVVGNVNGDGKVGGIAGTLYEETIEDDENCIYSAYIINSYFVGNVIGRGEGIGGIAGMNNGNISSAYTIGNISNVEDWVGGITGISYVGSVTNSYSLANISGDNVVGGITGFAYLASVFQYNVAINPFVGGIQRVNRIAGDISSDIGKFSDNFAFDNMGIIPTGINDNEDIGYDGYNGISKTLTELQTKETYSNSTLDGGLGWKFGNDNNNPWVWGVFDDYPYPTFYWQSERP
ncbi:MAG: hypothetical protein LBD84_04955 [Campylobacteraceae bacterium]|jgi:hypothetical protein|nr:hypothetical protein [Campylobacteraceae bacterium]